MKKTSFRYDINFLRAIAVLGVLFFHYKVPFFSGGFSGVDIFFVISGYLMTRIIINGLDRKDFSLGEFYGKRLKRIVPALVVLILVLLVICFIFYLPSDYSRFSRNACSSLLFLSNILYWKSSNYFDPNSETNLLLHTWSLSVEWQFYLLFPIVLLIVYKLFKSQKSFFAVFTILTIFIMIGSFFLTKKASTASFFLLPSRSWEMMAGGIAFLMEKNNIKLISTKVLSLLGYAILVGGIVLLNSDMSWPGMFTIIPVFATFIIIAANVNDISFVKNKIVQFVGKISYSLYLWHWPVYVFAYYIGIEMSVYNTIFLLGLSFILGYLSYRFVESLNFNSNIKILAVGSLLIIVTGAFNYFTPNKIIFKEKTIQLADYENLRVNKKEQFLLDTCFVKKLKSSKKGFNEERCLRFVDGKKNILLLGDSHAAQFSRSLTEMLSGKGINLLQATSSGCFPVVRKNGDTGCSEIMDFIFKEFIPKNASHIDGVAICANWVKVRLGKEDELFGDLEETQAYLKKFNIPLILIGQNETYTASYPTIIAKEYEYGREVSSNYLNEKSYKIDEVLSKRFGAIYIDIINKKHSDIPKTPNDMYMFDENHFSKYGADFAVKKMLSNSKFNKFISAERASF